MPDKQKSILLGLDGITNSESRITKITNYLENKWLWFGNRIPKCRYWNDEPCILLVIVDKYWTHHKRVRRIVESFDYSTVSTWNRWRAAVLCYQGFFTTSLDWKFFKITVPSIKLKSIRFCAYQGAKSALDLNWPWYTGNGNGVILPTMRRLISRLMYVGFLNGTPAADTL